MTTVTPDLIDRRLNLLYERMEAARAHYHDDCTASQKDFVCSRRAYHDAVTAYNLAARRYGRSAPTVRVKILRFPG